MTKTPVEIKRQKDTERKRKWYADNREHYRTYQREYRRKQAKAYKEARDAAKTNK